MGGLSHGRAAQRPKSEPITPPAPNWKFASEPVMVIPGKGAQVSTAVHASRISALALALGIGAGITGFGIGVASADPVDSAAGSPVGQTAPRRSTRPASQPRPPATQRTANRVAAIAIPPRLATSDSPGRSRLTPSPAGPVESSVSWMVAAAASRTRTRAAALPAASVGTGQALSASAPKAAAQTTDPFTSFFSGLAATFFNQPPTLHPIQTGQGANGVVSGVVGGADPDSAALTYTVARNPEHGRVAVDADGTYTYTPDPSAGAAGTTDSFVVTVSDAGNGFHIHGLFGLINALTFGLIGDSGHSGGALVSVTVTPFNNLPTGHAIVGRPDPTTGVVLGSIIGTDADGDTLTYRGSATTGKGSVIVTAAGDFTYTPTSQSLQNAAAPTATAADRQDNFDVTIDDGRGGIVAVAITVPVGTNDTLSTFCGCTLMPANTVFHADVSNLPVLAKSNTWITLLGGTLRATWGGDPWMGNTGGMPVNTVSASHRTERVIFNRGLTTSGPSIDDRPYAIPDYPIVEGMPNVPAWDRHLLVFQEGTCISQELYNVANGVELPANSIGDALANGIYASQYGSAWIAEAGVRYDMGDPLYPVIGEANASQLPYLPLILRPDDLTRGNIDHMLGITIAKDRGTGYTWPARAGDGTGTNPNGVPMGTVLRLRADFDISGYSSATQVILRALQQHGAVIYDSGNPGQDGAQLLAMSNGWTGTAYLTAQQQLRTVPMSAFEAVDVLSLAVDPSVGWAIGSSAV